MADGPLVRKCAIIDGHGAGQGRSEGFGFMVRGDNKAPFGNVSRFLLLGCVCCTVGLAVDSMWCILMGYTPAFVSSASDSRLFANPRVFYLSGALAVSLFCMILPGRLRRADGILRFVLPVLGAAGTVCFSLAAKGAMAFESPIVLCGLFVTGGVQFWIMARFILLLARSRGTGAVVACVTGWLVMRLPLVELVDGLANRNVQIVMAIAAPLVAAVLFEVACALLRRAAEAPSAGKSCVACGGVVSFCRKPDGSRALPKTIFGVPQLGPFHVASSRNERISTCLVMFVAAAVLAVVCSISDMGLWGVTNVVISESSPWLLGVAVPAVLVVVFACCALVLPNKLPLAVRFQPALFLTLAGLFAAAMQPSSSGEGLAALTMIIQISQLFARLLFWTVIATSLEVLDMPSYRTVGLGEAVYASVSLVWVSLLADAPKFVTLAVMFGLYILVIGLLYAVWGLSNRWGRSVAVSPSSSIAVPPSSDVRGEPGSRAAVDGGAGADSTGKGLLSSFDGDGPKRSVLDQCLALAEERGLSPPPRDRGVCPACAGALALVHPRRAWVGAKHGEDACVAHLCEVRGRWTSGAA